MDRRVAIPLAGTIIAIVALTVAFTTGKHDGKVHKTGAAADSAQAHGHAQSNGPRTLVVARRGNRSAMSRPGQTMHGSLVRGRPPKQATLAQVETDENCQPDAQGVSRCTNRLRTSDGKSLTVVHPHRMAEVPCMTPGEEVKVVAA
jgi:hypothetical protein